MPALVIGRQQDQGESTTTYSTTLTNFCPEQRFFVGTSNTWWWPFSSSTTLLTGGWSVGVFSLQTLYEEHKFHKNRWSASNCGFDSASYHGTTMYLQQHQFIDYIFFWDTEYRNMNDFLQNTALHPLDLLINPQATLIKSRERSGPRRTRKVYIPRPAWWASGWADMRDCAKTGMFIYWIMAVDLDNPWLGKHQAPTTPDKGQWWQNMNWYTKFLELVRDENTNTNTAKRQAAWDDSTNKQIRGGPFMLRSWKVEHEHYIYPQITFFYKSYWRWGGRTLTIKSICDPSKPFGPPGS